jgi:hypothetical protein
MATGFPNWLGLGTGQDLLDLRWTGARWTCSFWGLINHVRSTADGRTIPRLDLAPGELDGTEQFVMFYRAGWTTPEDDGAPLPLPMSGWLNALFLEVVKAFALGQEEEEKAALAVRLEQVRASSLFTLALARDQTMQAQVGRIRRGGWTDSYMYPHGGGWFDKGTVLGTSV